MTESNCCSHDDDMPVDKGDKFSKGSVCQWVPPEVAKILPQLNTKTLKHPPVSCHESESLQSWDYFDDDERAERLVAVPNFTFYNSITLRRELARMVVLHEYPLSMVDHIGFKDFLQKLNPSFGMISRNTLENDIMKMFEFERSNACIVLSENSSSRIAITTKMWTSDDGNRRFLAITGHMIDSDWKRQSHILRFADVPLPCTSESISQVIFDCFSYFQVEKKLSTITVDTYTFDDKIIDILMDKLSGNELVLTRKLFRLPCFAHTMSLMVQDGFDMVKHVIKKIQDSIFFWTSSPKRERAFEKAAYDLGIKTNTKLVLDDGLNWSSTYLMLQESLVFKDVFSHLGQQEPQYQSFPSKEEWEVTREVCSRLKVLYDRMKNLAELPASCTYLTHICRIKLAIFEWLEHDCEVPGIKEMALKMEKKFDKYWSAARDVLGLAALFHPKFRFVPLNFFFPKIYGNESANEVEKICHIFYELFNEYKNSLPMDESETNEVGPHLSEDLLDFDMFLKKTEPETSEVDSYLKMYFGPKTEFDILSWWEGNKRSFPILHKMAKDILAIPIFSVEAENAFDAGERILGANRSKLQPTMVEALMCSQRWLRLRKLSDSKVSSSASSNLNLLGTIYDDANVKHGIFLQAKSAKAGDDDEPLKKKVCIEH